MREGAKSEYWTGESKFYAVKTTGFITEGWCLKGNSGERNNRFFLLPAGPDLFVLTS